MSSIELEFTVKILLAVHADHVTGDTIQNVKENLEDAVADLCVGDAIISYPVVRLKE